MRPGCRVVLTDDVDLLPDALLRRDERGTVEDVTDDGAYIRMDVHHPGLDHYPYGRGLAFLAPEDYISVRAYEDHRMPMVLHLPRSTVRVG